MPDGGVPQPVQVATEALARNAETAAAVDMSNADFSAAARKGTGAALVSRPDYSPAVRGERPGAELMQLIAGGRSLLPDGAGIAVQSQTPVNIPVTAEGVTDFSQTPSAIRGQIPTLVGQPGWDRAVGEQALWFVSQNIKVASLRLNPAHLGPMEMMVTMDGDEANVAFASSNAIVREALESAIPRLREMLSENGLNLGNVHVSHQGLSDQRGHRPHGSQLPVDGRTADTSPGDLHAEPAVPAGIRIPLGLVDYYA
jgi:flagellar hook-length control protein FliK